MRCTCANNLFGKSIQIRSLWPVDLRGNCNTCTHLSLNSAIPSISLEKLLWKEILIAVSISKLSYPTNLLLRRQKNNSTFYYSCPPPPLILSHAPPLVLGLISRSIYVLWHRYHVTDTKNKVWLCFAFELYLSTFLLFLWKYLFLLLFRSLVMFARCFRSDFFLQTV